MLTEKFIKMPVTVGAILRWYSQWRRICF